MFPKSLWGEVSESLVKGQGRTQLWLQCPVSLSRNFSSYLPPPHQLTPHITCATAGEATERREGHGQFLPSSLFHCLPLIQVTLLGLLSVWSHTRKSRRSEEKDKVLHRQHFNTGLGHSVTLKNSLQWGSPIAPSSAVSDANSVWLLLDGSSTPLLGCIPCSLSVLA